MFDGILRQRLECQGRDGDREKRIVDGFLHGKPIRETNLLDGQVVTEQIQFIAKGDEAAILERWGFGHVVKSGCYMCPYQPLSWFWVLARRQPVLWKRTVAYEAAAYNDNPKMRLFKGKSLEEAVRFGSAAGAECVQVAGAEPGLPTRDKVEARLAG